MYAERLKDMSHSLYVGGNLLMDSFIRDGEA